MKARCPKCNSILKSSKSKNNDINLLSLNLLFGVVSLKKDKKAKCDLCGARLRK